MANTQRPSLKRLILQAQLNKFYSHPVARVSVGLVLTILAIVFFALVAIRPTLETMAQLIKQIDDKKQVDQQLSLKIASLGTAQAELAAKQEDAKVLDFAVPSTPTFSILLKELEKLTSENNASIISLTTQEVPVERDPATVTQTDLQSIPISMSIRGTYATLLATLKGFSSLQRILVIDRVDIFPTTDGDSGSLNMSLSLRAFAFGNAPLPKVIKKVVVPAPSPIVGAQ